MFAAITMSHTAGLPERMLRLRLSFQTSSNRVSPALHHIYFNTWLCDRHNVQELFIYLFFGWRRGWVVGGG